MFRVIRVSSDYGVVVIADTADGNDGYGDPAAKFFLYDDNHEPAVDFTEITKDNVLPYFSDIADGMGWGEIPEKLFATLDEARVWRREHEQQVISALVRELATDRGISVDGLDDDQVREAFQRSFDEATMKEDEKE